MNLQTLMHDYINSIATKPERENAADVINNFEAWLCGRGYKLDAVPTEYTRPEKTDDMKYQAEQDAKKLIQKYGFGNFPRILALLVLENVMLTREVNDHRAARGIEQLQVYEV